MFQEVGDPVLLNGFVAGADPDPDSTATVRTWGIRSVSSRIPLGSTLLVTVPLVGGDWGWFMMCLLHYLP